MAYRGFTVEVPINVGGQHGAQNPSQIPPTHLAQTFNSTFENGTLQKEGGAAKYNATAITGAPTVKAGHDWWPNATQRMVIYTGDKLLKDSGDGTFGITLASLLADSDVCLFVDGGQEAAALVRKLFIFTGTNQLKVLAGDGITAPNVATPPADWATSFPTFGVIHSDGRLWGGGNANDPHRVYFSTNTNHEDFIGPGSGSLSIYPGEGQRLVAGLSYKGLLILWKYPAGIYIVDTTNPLSAAETQITRHTGSIGTRSPQAIVVAEGDIFFPDQVGHIQQFSSVQEFGSIGSRNLSDLDDMNSLFRNEFDLPTNLAKLRAVYYSKKREVHFALPSVGSVVNDRRVVLVLNKGAQGARWRVSDRDVCSSLWLRLGGQNEQQLVAGDDSGFVWLMDRTAKNKDGVGYQTYIQTAHINFSHVDPLLAAKNKIGQFLELITDAIGAFDIKVEVFWDAVLTQTLTFSGATGSVIGSFVLDTDLLSGTSILSERRRLEGSGKTLSLAFSNNGVDEDFSIANAVVSFNVGDER